eukprot:scaffold659_cov192-Ochromonas_danica.AAC.46
MPTNPTGQPTSTPSGTKPPTGQPTGQPSMHSRKPTVYTSPTPSPSRRPTFQPSLRPTSQPTSQPTSSPSVPTSQPSGQPSTQPSQQPFAEPTSQPTSQPTNPTARPTSQPTGQPFSRPTSYPSLLPIAKPSGQPTTSPSSSPTYTHQPTGQPSSRPSKAPSGQPSSRPTGSPTLTYRPTKFPTGEPSSTPSVQPSGQPSGRPSSQPTLSPTSPTSQPSGQPSAIPTGQPVGRPTSQPSSQPSMSPTSQPSSQPSAPSGQPSSRPSSLPSAQPTTTPTNTYRPSSIPTSRPTSLPSGQPSRSPTSIPTRTYRPTPRPSSRPTSRPTSSPTFEDGVQRSIRPTAYYESLGITGTVEFQPDRNSSCDPVAINIYFTLSRVLFTNSILFFSMPGITSGICTRKGRGNNIARILLTDSTLYRASYTEGIYQNNFADSLLTVTFIGTNLSTGTTQQIYIDRKNALRRHCSSNTTWSIIAKPRGKSSGSSGFVDRIEIYPRKGFVYASYLTFINAYPQQFTSINLTLSLPFEILSGTQITINLPGFTSYYGDFPLNYLEPMNDYGRGQVFDNGFNTILSNLTSNTTFSWSGRFYVGSSSDGYLSSKIVLTTYGFSSLPIDFWILIPRSNRLTSVYGRPLNYNQFTFGLISPYYIINITSFTSTSPIGTGCDNLNGCNSQGQCDYTFGRCLCDDGFGSSADKEKTLTDDFPLDCSGRACPIGPAFNSLVTGNTPNTSYDDSANVHRVVECSNNGLCNRNNGTCQCYAGYTGLACEKMACQGNPVCSDRGRCLPMYRLARTMTALPLSTSLNNYYPILSGTPASWDYETGQQCVCDSSWPVGLQAGETQQAEYFGPACQFRHCPSGDDPVTLYVNETNCEGISITGGADVGEAGNLCHVDCSNRGVCDYTTGLCTCYVGFKGVNCGTRV